MHVFLTVLFLMHGILFEKQGLVDEEHIMLTNTPLMAFLFPQAFTSRSITMYITYRERQSEETKERESMNPIFDKNSHDRAENHGPNMVRADEDDC